MAPLPHQLALFTFVPLNSKSLEVVQDEKNAHLVSRIQDSHSSLGLDVGHKRSRIGHKTMLTSLGRDADIHIGNAHIARLQCSFVLDPDTGFIVFYDNSHNQSSRVHEYDSIETIKFDTGRPRKVVVMKDLNPVIGMGGVSGDWYLFRLKWHDSPDGQARLRNLATLDDVPQAERTLDEDETILGPPILRIRPHQSSLGAVRYRKLDKLGAGAFGIVHKALNVDTGKLMALKVIRRSAAAPDSEWHKIKKEVEILSSLSHEHIVNYIFSQNWGRLEAEIFTGLKDGSLHQLLHTESYTHGHGQISLPGLGQRVLKHMLEALSYLEPKRIIHRDVKPENILYTLHNREYSFQLSDFGISSNSRTPVTCIGTFAYMAPEIARGGQQTCKADMFSLFVTMLYVMDTGGFRAMSGAFNIDIERRDFVVLGLAAATTKLKDLRPMSSINLDERPSAVEMHEFLFAPNGLMMLPRGEPMDVDDPEPPSNPRSAAAGPSRQSPPEERQRRRR